MEFKLEQVDKKLNDTYEKERDLRKFARETKVLADDLKDQHDQTQETQQREFSSLDKRMKKLSDWLKDDTDKLFSQMNAVERQSDTCSDQVKVYTAIVQEL